MVARRACPSEGIAFLPVQRAMAGEASKVPGSINITDGKPYARTALARRRPSAATTGRRTPFHAVHFAKGRNGGVAWFGGTSRLERPVGIVLFSADRFLFHSTSRRNQPMHFELFAGGLSLVEIKTLEGGITIPAAVT
jgi:hypothetical protein